MYLRIILDRSLQEEARKQIKNISLDSMDFGLNSGVCGINIFIHPMNLDTLSEIPGAIKYRNLSPKGIDNFKKLVNNDE